MCQRYRIVSKQLVGRVGRVLSRLAIEAAFGSEVGIKGVLEALMCVSVCTDYRYRTGSNALQIELGGRHWARLEQELCRVLG